MYGQYPQNNHQITTIKQFNPQNIQNQYSQRNLNNHNKIDVIFQEQPTEVQEKLMKLLIQYNASLHYNQVQDNFQCDVLIPFNNFEEKKKFLENYHENRIRKSFNKDVDSGLRNYQQGYTTNKNHSQRSHESRQQHRTHHHNTPSKRQHFYMNQEYGFNQQYYPKNTQKSQRHSSYGQNYYIQDYNQQRQLSQNSNKINKYNLQFKQAENHENYHQTPKIKSDKMNQYSSLNQNRCNSERQDKNNQIKRQNQIIEVTQQSCKNSQNSNISLNYDRIEQVIQGRIAGALLKLSHINKNQKSVKNKLEKKNQNKQQGKQTTISKFGQKQLKLSVQDEKNWDQQNSIAQEGDLKNLHTVHSFKQDDRMVKNSTKMNSKTDSNNLIIKSKKKDNQEFFTSNRMQDHNESNNKMNANEILIEDNSVHSKQSEYMDKIVQQNYEDQDELFISSGRNKLKSNHVRKQKQHFRKQSNNKSDHNIIRARYSTFFKQNYQQLDRISDQIKKYLKNNSKYFNKSEQNSEILIQDIQQNDSINQQKVFKQQLMKQYQQKILVKNDRLSSQDLVRYFKYMLKNARGLYLKSLKNHK